MRVISDNTGGSQIGTCRGSPLASRVGRISAVVVVENNSERRTLPSKISRR